MEREYIVTAKSYEDLESLYNDLETIGGCDCIPDREVECAHRRPISRNTHYKLTAEEAELISKDPRVLSVELTPEERGAEVKPLYTINTTFWSKSTANSDAHRAWSMYRCVNGATVANWGSDGGSLSITGEVLFTSTGKNVDVVVVDGCFDPAHPEFATNEAGTGGSRVNQFNWFSLNPTVTGGSAGTYLYVNAGGNYINGSAQQQIDNNHGCHVAGTFAGNRRGWAREANIYNINPYSTAPSPISASLLIDYIRAWHNSKAVNATTGKKNPTITNHSYGTFLTINVSDVQSIIHRGTTYNSPNATDLNTYGVLNNGTTITNFPLSSNAASADISDAINDGIIFVAAAGNSSFKIDIPGGLDYNNSITYTFSGSTYTDFYHRGPSPAFNTNVICVGAVDALVTEQKATFSCTGPRVDVYAPGVNVVSSVHSNEGGVQDSRNTLYEVIKYNGTSMASPNVAGILACLAEQFPRMTQLEARTYLGAVNSWSNTPLSKSTQLSNTGTSSTEYTNNRSLLSGSNRYLQYPMVRKVPNPTGTTYIGGQTTSQITFPRENKFRAVMSDGNPDTNVYNSGFVYPRRPTWHRSLT